MDRLEAMTLLVAAVEAGSLSAAGRKLGIPLPSVSRKIADLEAPLGVTPPRPHHPQAHPDRRGAAYVEACRRLLSEVEETERAVKGEYTEPRGALSMTDSAGLRAAARPAGGLGLPVPVPRHHRAPRADRPGPGPRGGHVDLAIRISHLPDSDLVTARLGTVTRVVCGSLTSSPPTGRPGPCRTSPRFRA